MFFTVKGRRKVDAQRFNIRGVGDISVLQGKLGECRGVDLGDESFAADDKKGDFGWIKGKLNAA